MLEMCDWLEMHGVDVREIGPHASPDAISRWQTQSPASPENTRRASGLPPKTKGTARARLKESGAAELAWPGGRAGTRR
jgi:hypothetical protein